MNEAEMINLQSHTLGSIGQVFKPLKIKCSQEQMVEAYLEVERIYREYDKQLNLLLFRESKKKPERMIIKNEDEDI